jgi:RNA polymerase sigma-70 factor (ECF subfamily)
MNAKAGRGTLEEVLHPLMSQQPLDLQCMERLRAGDPRALRELYDRYGSLLYSVALRILGNGTDAEDAVQRCWVQAWQTAASYEPRRGPVAAWLLTMVRSRALDLARSVASRRRAEDAVEAESAPDPPLDPSDSAERRTLREKIAHAMESLSDEQRRVLQIAYFEGLSQSEVAVRVGAPLGTVKSWTRQGLERLRELLPKQEWV